MFTISMSDHTVHTSAAEADYADMDDHDYYNFLSVYLVVGRPGQLMQCDQQANPVNRNSLDLDEFLGNSFKELGNLDYHFNIRYE